MLKNPRQLKFLSPLKQERRIELQGSPDLLSVHQIEKYQPPPCAFFPSSFDNLHINESVTYTILAEDGNTWMTDIPAEQTSQHDALKKCKGRVLVGGLGIGYFVKKLQEKDNVDLVMVVEISRDVINLVWKHLKLDDRFIIRCCDIRRYLKGWKNKNIHQPNFDWVYLDVWRADSEYEFVDSVLPLKRLAYKTACDKVDHVLSWQENVMLGQLQTGLVTRLMVNFDEIMLMNVGEFDNVYQPNNKYTTTRRAFWQFVRKHELSIDEARNLVPTYMTWIQNGMQGEF